MQRLVALALAVCTLAGVAGLSAVAKDPPAPQQPPAKPAAAPAKTDGLGEFVIGDPVRYQNLTVFPVATKTLKNEDRYLTLDDGLKAKLVEVYEVGAEPGAAAVQPVPAPPSAERPARARPKGEQESGPVTKPSSQDERPTLPPNSPPAPARNRWLLASPPRLMPDRRPPAAGPTTCRPSGQQPSSRRFGGAGVCGRQLLDDHQPLH